MKQIYICLKKMYYFKEWQNNDGEFDKALEMFDEAAGEYKGQSVADVNLARIQYAVGITYKYKGNYEAAIANYAMAIGTLKSLGEAGGKPEEEMPPCMIVKRH
jgi:tetratricopeptide (TPR) repeat protein